MARPIVELSDRDIGELRRKLSQSDVSEYAAAQIVAIVEYAQRHKLSVKTIATLAEMSPGVVSQIVNLKYPGNYDMRARKFERFLRDQANREIFGPRDDFVETEIARSMWAICERTRYNRRIQPLQSEEQLGKSRCLAEYTRRNNHSHTAMVTLQPSLGSNPFGVFLRDFSLAVGEKDIHKLVEVRFKLREALSVCDLVIFDEVHMLRKWSDRAVGDFLDFVRLGVHQDGTRGVILVATNDDVLSFFQDFKKRTKYNLGQLLGRMCNEVLEINPDDIPISDIAALVGRYYRPGKRCLEKLFDIATRPKLGHYGLVLDIMNSAWTDSQLSGVSLTDELVLSIAQKRMETINSKPELYT